MYCSYIFLTIVLYATPLRPSIPLFIIGTYS
uniref:Uncharacterized protein n=1 Tax=virus sp. ctBM815 TaxID=2825806 RepID=A0A8S5RK90_9VIRU|nr:MAG TPA: hypothetical protein [virus sp. ctBM815]